MTTRPARALILAVLAGAAACADPLEPPAPTPRAVAAKVGADVSATAVSKGFRRAVTVEGVRAHQAALQAIADANDGLRTAGGSGGYEASLAYVQGRLAAAGYQLAVQEFPFEFNGDRTPPILARLGGPSYLNGVDFRTMTYSGSRDVTAPLVAVDLLVPSPAANSSTSGCEAADFAGFPAGAIALMQRGGCNFSVKADNALAAGATGAIIMNEGNAPDRTGLLAGTLGEPTRSLPVVGTTFALGNELRNGVLNGPTGFTVRLRTDVVIETRTGRNLVAETPAGDPSHAVVVGVRLDGGLLGPGINQASGAAVALQIAEVFAAQERAPRNKLRLVFTGAGSAGTLGLEYYLASLGAEGRAAIAAAVGLDAVGSPNFARFVYDGDGSDAGPALPPGSAGIEDLFAAYFTAEGLAIEPAAIPAGAETIVFADAGLPVGGLYGGSFEVKSAAQAATFGGTAGVAFDPCQNLACDTFANASLTALDQLSDAAAHVILVLTRRNFSQEPLIAP